MNRHRLDNLSWAMSEVYGATTDRILINLAKYFKYWKPGQQIPGSMQYQVRMLAQMGQVTRETVDIIAQSLGGADTTLRQAIESTILDALKDDEKKLQHAAQKGLVSGAEGPITPNQMQAFTMYYKQSVDGLNLVNTTMLRSTQAAYAATVADVSQRIQQIQSALNVGAGEVITGVSTWNEAMHDAVQKMVKTGITGFFDRAGHHWKPETYAAMTIRTTLANTSRKAVWERNEQYGNDLYQVSYHNGARPLCYPWQTKVLSTSGRTGKTTDYDGNEVIIHSEAEVESFRYGGGLFGINCGHYPMVFIPGVSSVREVKQTEEENAKAYKESQHQRALERKLREEKRDLEVLKAQGAGEDQIKAQQAKVKKASHDIQEFCDATGRPRDRIREYTPIDAKWPDIPNVPPVTPPVTPPAATPAAPPVATKPTIGSAKDFAELRTAVQDAYGVTVDATIDALDYDMVHEAMRGVDSMFTKYPVLTQNIKTITTSKSGVMSCNGERITFNPAYFTTSDKLKAAIKDAVRDHWWPQNTSLSSIAAHECGHGLEWAIIVNDPQYLSRIFMVNAWNRCSVASAIVSEAAKAAKKQSYGSGKSVAELIRSVSTYATKTRSEAMAEAFGDVEANGANANPFSHEIVRVTKEFLNRVTGGTP